MQQNAAARRLAAQPHLLAAALLALEEVRKVASDVAHYGGYVLAEVEKADRAFAEIAARFGLAVVSRLRAEGTRLR